jgi:hypothetical protein
MKKDKNAIRHGHTQKALPLRSSPLRVLSMADGHMSHHAVNQQKDHSCSA